MVTTTSATSSSSATASILDSSSKAAKANVVSKLGGGSGIDTQSLASSLVDAERAPRQAAIDKNIKKNEAIVSGLAAMKYALSNLKSAFDDLKDVTDYKSMVVSNTNTTAFSATANSTASAAAHTVEVTALAAAQRTAGTVAVLGGSPDRLAIGRGSRRTAKCGGPARAWAGASVDGAGRRSCRRTATRSLFAHAGLRDRQGAAT
jgi:hypothetical protein